MIFLANRQAQCLRQGCHGSLAYHMPTHVKSLSRHKISSGSHEPVDWLSLGRTGGSVAREYSQSAARRQGALLNITGKDKSLDCETIKQNLPDYEQSMREDVFCKTFLQKGGCGCFLGLMPQVLEPFDIALDSNLQVIP